MPLTITDFVEQEDGLTVEDVPPRVQERVNDALADLTGGPGGGNPPGNPNAILVSKNLDGRAGFESIQDAIDGTNGKNGASGATPGDTIFVEPGTYTDAVDISSTSDLTIKSTQGSGSTTLSPDASVDNEAIRIDDVAGITIEGLEITFDGTDSGNGEKYGIRVRAGSDDVTVRDCQIGGFSASDVASNTGAVRVTGVTVTSIQGSNPGTAVSNPTIENNTFEDMKCTGGVDPSNSPDNDSRAKGIAMNGDVPGATITDNTITDIGSAGGANESPTTAEEVSAPGVEGTEKPRGITLTEDGSGVGPTDFVIDNNVLGGTGSDAIVGTWGQPAIFIGGTNSLGTHDVRNNEFYHPVDNLSSEALDLGGENTWYDTSGNTQTPSLVPADADEDGGNLIDRSPAEEAYNHPVVDVLVSKNLAGRPGFLTIQDAIDGTNPQNGASGAALGDTIFVEPGTYTEDVTVDKTDLTVLGTTDPTGGNAATIDGTLTASASGVTIERLKLAPSTEYDIDSGVDPNILLASADDVVVRNNLLEGLRADATGSNNSGSLNGIQVFDASNSPVGGITIENNTVRDIVVDGDASAGWPNYGGAAAIKVQGTLDGVDVIGNTVEEVYSAGWVWGIVMTHTGTTGFSNISPKDVTVEENTVRKLNTVGSQFNPTPDGSATYVGNGFGIDGNSDADEATVTNNNFVQVPHGVQSKDPDNTLDVRNNWWGDSTGPSTGVVPSSVSQVTDADTGVAADGNGTGISITDPNVDVRFDPWLNNSV